MWWDYAWLSLQPRVAWLVSGCRLHLTFRVPDLRTEPQASILQCQPISAAWSSRAGNAHCGVNALALQLAHTSFNLLTDVIILLLPIPIVIKLKASVGSKGALQK